MTNLEVIQIKPTFQSLSQELIKKVLEIRSLNWADLYAVSSLQNIELTTADLYIELLTVPAFKEGSLSIDYDASQLLKMAKIIYKKYSDPKLDELNGTNDTIEAIKLW